MGVQGTKRENQFNNERYVGLGEVKVIAINPDTEEYKDLLGIELKEESKATEYIGESKDGNTTLRIDVWVECAKLKGKKDKITFFLEDKQKINKEDTKKQYINTLGSCSWADDPNNLPDWFTKRDYRNAYNGEEEFCNFLRTWLGGLNFMLDSASLSLDWKSLMKGNIKEWRVQIGGEFSVPFIALYTVKTVDKGGEVKEYQSIFNKAFLPSYSLKNFRLIDYNKDEVLEPLKKKKPKELKPHEKFVVIVKSEFGCRDSYTLKDVKEYNSEEFLVASNSPISEGDPSY